MNNTLLTNLRRKKHVAGLLALIAFSLLLTGRLPVVTTNARGQ